ncbi:MAG: ribosome small subunit-dependent GTPase A, partial [Treponema sp.]|nr:ribosome small subunit-dependent GTPase A [Treponema sp.]
MSINLNDYGYTQADSSAACDLLKNNSDLIPARVIERRRELYKVICEHGEAGTELKGSFYHQMTDEDKFPSVGDFVLIQYNHQGSSLITTILPRRSKFSRANLGGHAEGYAKFIKEQVVAVNFDTVFILSSLNDDFNPARIARYLSASWQSGGFPVVLLTKADLCSSYGIQAAETQKLAREAPVIPISSKTGYGLEDLAPFLEPSKTIVFLGSSGVGKSSLLNRLAGEDLMEVKTIREDDSKGRHTTTHRQLFRLHSGVLIIDTPGMRELGLWDSREGMSMAFGEVEDLISRCRFSDCTHQGEPGCAIRSALEEGTITPMQWKNYQKQLRETVFVENHTDYLKKKREFRKSIAQMNRNKSIRQKNRFYRRPGKRYKLPEILYSGGKNEIQQRRKSHVAGRLEAE